jgi:hypothetical protein
MLLRLAGADREMSISPISSSAVQISRTRSPARSHAVEISFPKEYTPQPRPWLICRCCFPTSRQSEYVGSVFQLSGADRDPNETRAQPNCGRRLRARRANTRPNQRRPMKATLILTASGLIGFVTYLHPLSQAGPFEMAFASVWCALGWTSSKFSCLKRSVGLRKDGSSVIRQRRGSHESMGSPR